LAAPQFPPQRGARRVDWDASAGARDVAKRIDAVGYFLAAAFAMGCADRVARLDPVDPYIEAPIPLAAAVRVPSESVHQEYTAAGTPIRVGEAFEQYADAYVRRGFSGTGEAVIVTAELRRVHAESFRIEIDAEIRVETRGREVLRSLYSGTSPGNAWDGLYADRKLYWEQATGRALRSLFQRFLDDARTQHRTW
jgi:hypothetical protein